MRISKVLYHAFMILVILPFGIIALSLSLVDLCDKTALPAVLSSSKFFTPSWIKAYWIVGIAFTAFGGWDWIKILKRQLPSLRH
jgi:hypothetical protein